MYNTIFGAHKQQDVATLAPSGLYVLGLLFVVIWRGHDPAQDADLLRDLVRYPSVLGLMELFVVVVHARIAHRALQAGHLAAAVRVGHQMHVRDLVGVHQYVGYRESGQEPD